MKVSFVKDIKDTSVELTFPTCLLFPFLYPPDFMF